jgi:hypothetical protein
MPDPKESTSKELRERFASEKKTESNPNAMAQLLGITAMNMVDTITSDISTMIEKEYRAALEGYVLCLSRIMNHDTAWQCITDAFLQKGEKLPKKYYKQFGKDPEQLPQWKGMTVK